MQNAKHRLQKVNRGFTLIDLLVTMAILAILLAVVLPATMQARNRARAASCASNLRQLSSAVMLYSQDWSERLPKLKGTPFARSYPLPAWPEGTSATEARTIISSRVRSAGAFRCLNDSGTEEFGFDDPNKPTFISTGSSYLPWSSARTGRYGDPLNGGIVSSLASPSSRVLFRDYGSDWHGYRSRRGLTVSASDQVNSVYADGHAQSTPVYQITTQQGTYSAIVSGSSGNYSGPVNLDGSFYSSHVELTGSCTTVAGSDGREDLVIEVSGSIWTAGAVYDVDRKFTFGADRGLTPALQQILDWVENRAGL